MPYFALPSLCSPSALLRNIFKTVISDKWHLAHNSSLAHITHRRSMPGAKPAPTNHSPLLLTLATGSCPPSAQLRILTQRVLQLGCIVALLCLPLDMKAQSPVATLSGTVTDTSGALITKAQVTVTNEDTGTTITTHTTGGGVYVVPALSPGRYRVFVEHQGFKQVEVSDLELHVQDTVSRNFVLPVGAMSETVQVNGNQNTIETSGTVSTVIDHAFIENMPLNGNSLSTLFELTPGTVTNASNGSVANPGAGGGLSVNGQRGTSNYLTLDGASENIYIPLTSGSKNVTGQGIAVSASGGTNGLLPTDAVEEYRIQTSTYSAEYGRTPGGQIGIRTRGGSNDFHGSLFENFRNQVMDATDYFIKFLNEKQTPLRMNDFGGTLGGPILKDKVFFFVAHESLMMTQPQSGTSIDVPSDCAKATAANALQPFLAAFPLGNGDDVDTTQPLCSTSNPNLPASSTNPTISDTFSESFSDRIKDHSTSARIDANLPWKSQAFFRINRAPSDEFYTGWSASSVSTNIWTTTGGITSQITPRVINEATINFSENKNQLGTNLLSYGGNSPSTFESAVASIANPATTQFEFVDTSWIGAYPTIGPQQYNTMKQWNAIDTVSWTFGRHSLKFGADYLGRNPILKPYSLSLLPEITSYSGLQSGTLSFLSYSQNYSNPDLALTSISFFANDTWRITKTLTLNYGLRWEINPSPSASSPGLLAVEGNIANPSTITEAPAGTPLFSTVYTNFAPRFGFADSLRSNPRFGTVVRGGVGIFFDTGMAATASQAAQEGYPYKGNGSLSNIPFSSVNWSGLKSSTPSLPQATLYITDPNLQAPRTYQWSLTVEQGLGSGATLSASYVANDGQKLISTVGDFDGEGTPITTFFQNPMLNSSYGTFELVTNGADSNYQSLQMQLRSHIASRLDAIASWTWSHDIDNGDSDFSGPYSIATYSSRSDSSNDIRHIFSSAIHYNPTGFRENHLLKAITGGWSLDTIALLQTASPLSVSANLPTGISEEFNGLADLVPGVSTILHTNVNPVTGKPVPGGKMLNPAAFSTPICACNGDSTRNGYRLFGLTQWDLSGSRSWNLWENATFNFKVDAFNLLNIANLTNVRTLYTSSTLNTFGEAQNTYAGNYGSAGGAGGGTLNTEFQNGGARSIQLSAKVRF
jgi:hypothetical protein